jgi:uncharacterized delta-60 repeat protein
MRRFARFACLPALAVALSATGLAATEHLAVAADAARLDTTYGTNGTATMSPPEGDVTPSLADAVDAEGRVLTASWGGSPAVVRRLTAAGALDLDFGDGGRVELEGFSVLRMVPVAGSIFLGGHDEDGAAVVRLTEGGEVDTSWGDDGLLAFPDADGSTVTALAIGPQGDGAAAVADGLGLETEYELVRFDAAGNRSTAFAGDGTSEVTGMVSLDGLAVDGQHRIVVSRVVLDGPVDVAQPQDHGELDRLLPSGVRDMSFGDGGTRALGPGGGGVVAIEADGDVLVGGDADPQQDQAAVWRLHSDGSLDATFGAGGEARLPVGMTVPELAPLADGRVAVAAETQQARQALVLRPDGSVETAFDPTAAVTSRHVFPWDGFGVDAQDRIYLIDQLLDPPSDGHQSSVTSARRYSTADLPSVAPAITSVRPGRDAVSVLWDASDVPVGGEVRSYWVVALDHGAYLGSSVVASDAREATVTGLPDGGRVDVWVVPVTDSGLQQPSASWSGAPSASAPAPVLATGPGAEAHPLWGAASVEWNTPQDDGGSPIVAYSVAAVDDATGELAAWRNLGADARSTSFPLTNGRSYHLYVFPVTSAGFGNPGVAGVSPSTLAPAPSAPTLPWVTAVRVGDAARVSWGPDVEHGQVVAAHHVLVVRDGQLVGWYVAAADARASTIPNVGGAGTQVYVAAGSSTELGPLVGPLALDPTTSGGSLPTTG